MSEIVITTLAERPEYLERMYEFADAWPEFMHNDPIGNAFMGQVPVRFPDQCVVATEDGELVAHGRSIPFVFPDENRTELPSGGWDRVLHWGFADLRNGPRAERVECAGDPDPAVPPGPRPVPRDARGDAGGGEGQGTQRPCSRRSGRTARRTRISR